MRVLLLANGAMADALAGALLDCPQATFVGALCSSADRTRLLEDRGNRSLAKRLTRAGVRQYLCDGVGRPAFVHRLETLAPDVVLMATWPERIAESRFAHGPARWINCHPSLLPRWRGANPYAAAILAGDTTTGVSFHRIDRGLDTGPVLLRETVVIERRDTGGDLRRRCAETAAAVLPRLVEQLAGEPDAPGTDQSTLGEASRCLRLRPDDARLDLEADAESVARRVRAVQPWLNPWVPLAGSLRRLYVGLAAAGEPDDDPANTPGAVLGTGPGEVRVKTGDGGSVRLGRLAAGNVRVPVPAGVAAKLLGAGAPAQPR